MKTRFVPCVGLNHSEIPQEIPSGTDCDIAIENGHRNSEFSQKYHGDVPWFFVNVYQRVNLHFPMVFVWFS